MGEEGASAMVERSEISSLAILLEEVQRRVSTMADAAQASEDAEAAELIGLERSLQAALRRLRRLA